MLALAEEHGRRVTGISLRYLNDSMRSASFLALVVGGGGVGLIVLFSALLIRRELRPLQQVAQTAREVAATHLDRGEVHLPQRCVVDNPYTEVGQVGGALSLMLKHVEESLSARHDSEQQIRRFMSDASHELRTPLAAISGYIQLLRRQQLEKLLPAAAPLPVDESLVQLEYATKRMSQLVEDMLLLARLDAAANFPREAVDLGELALDALHEVQLADTTHHWMLDLPLDEDEAPDFTITADATRLRQMVNNLLTNARVHTPPDTTVTLGLHLSQDNKWVVLQVADDGPGIEPQLVPHIFGRFVRGSGTSQVDIGSSGLGLAIVQAVANAHGGSVTLSGPPGAVFTVRLPLHEGKAAV